jgi:osmotically-inducible protein OsmY
VLPVDVVERAAGEDIYLSISSEGLDNYPEYRVVEFEEPAPGVKEGMYDRDDVRCWMQGYRMACREPVIPVVRRKVQHGVPTGGAVIEAGTAVANRQGMLGHVDHLVVDSKTGEVSHLVVRKGLLPYYPILPIAAIKAVSDDTVRVSLSKQAIDALPRYRRRDSGDIRAELDDRLAELPFDLSHVETSLEGGTVLLVGWVNDIAAKRRVEGIARSIEGVIDVQNELKTGMGLTMRVVNALLSDARTDLSVIEVVNERGVITLKGTVDSVEVSEAAAGIAAEQPGVVSVVNALEVNPDEDTEPLRARWLALGMMNKRAS